jgi:hypothetical protein
VCLMVREVRYIKTWKNKTCTKWSQISV